MGFLALFGNRDKKNELLELQKIVLVNSPDKLILSEKKLLEEATRMARMYLEIMRDCIRIMSRTNNPDTFFSRFDLLIEKADGLRKFEKYISFTESPSAAYGQLWEERQECIRQFLVRYFSDVLYKSENLKTDRAKVNKFQKFYDRLQPYYDQMNKENIEYIENQYKAYTKRLKA